MLFDERRYQHEPVIALRHSALRSADDGLFKKHCVKCRDGLLLMRRDQTDCHLLAEDACLLCGQQYRYTDLHEEGLV